MTLSVGDKFYPSSALPDFCTIAKIVRSAKTGRLGYVDDSGTRYAADAVEPYTPVLTDAEIETLLVIVDSILAGEEPIGWLQELEPDHKAHLWAVLTVEQRSALKTLAAGAAAA